MKVDALSYMLHRANRKYIGELSYNLIENKFLSECLLLAVCSIIVFVLSIEQSRTWARYMGYITACTHEWCKLMSGE